MTTVLIIIVTLLALATINLWREAVTANCHLQEYS
jgi:hypothetical protein